VDGHSVKIEEKADRICRVIMYNKPEGELSTRKAYFPSSLFF